MALASQFFHRLIGKGLVLEGTKIRLRRQKNADGKEFLVGTMSKMTRLIVVENDRKTKPDEPDAYAYIVPTVGPVRLPT